MPPVLTSHCIAHWGVCRPREESLAHGNIQQHLPSSIIGDTGTKPKIPVVGLMGPLYLFVKYIHVLDTSMFWKGSFTGIVGTAQISFVPVRPRCCPGRGGHTRRTLTGILGDQSVTVPSAADCHRHVT